jgi:predicted DCC family thiol-disulfide oxidoreductase YuxK
MQTVVFFDGMCNLCNGAVKFIIKRDVKNTFKFASLQSDFAKSELAHFDVDFTAPSSFILLYQGKIYLKSTAALMVAKKINGLWPLCYFFIIVPRFIRDWVYSLIAKNRYRWFGKLESCWVPNESLRHKFLS